MAATIPIMDTMFRVFAGNSRHRPAKLVVRRTGRMITATAPQTASGEARNAAAGWPRPRSIPACVPPQNGHGTPVSISNGQTVWGRGSQASQSNPKVMAVSRAKAFCTGRSPCHRAVMASKDITMRSHPLAFRPTARASMSRPMIPVKDQISTRQWTSSRRRSQLFAVHHRPLAGS
jgi:hypothetical protein